MLKRFIRNEEGQDVIEWGMLAAFLSVLLVVAVTTISLGMMPCKQISKLRRRRNW
jgi:Flp pilus assembly pilin Flp